MHFLILLVAAAYLALCGLALLSDHVIFQPHPSSYHLADLRGPSLLEVRPLSLVSGRTNIAAVYLPNPVARYTLLFSHGNAEDLGDDLPMLEEYRRAGFGAMRS